MRRADAKPSASWRYVFGFPIAKIASRVCTRVVLVGWIDRFGESRPIVSGGTRSPKRGSRTSSDGRSRAHRRARRRCPPFRDVPTHGENFNAYTNRPGCARASRRVPRSAHKLSRGSPRLGSRIDHHPSNRSDTTESDIRATKKPRDIRASERLTLNPPLRPVSRLAPRSPSPARRTPRTVIPRTSSGASPTRLVRATHQTPACDSIPYSSDSFAYTCIHYVLKIHACTRARFDDPGGFRSRRTGFREKALHAHIVYTHLTSHKP